MIVDNEFKIGDKTYKIRVAVATELWWENPFRLKTEFSFREFRKRTWHQITMKYGSKSEITPLEQTKVILKEHPELLPYYNETLAMAASKLAELIGKNSIKEL